MSETDDFGRQLLQHLVESGVVSSDDMDRVLQAQKSLKLSLRAAIVSLGLADDATIIRHWVKLRGIPTIDLASTSIEPEAAALLTREMCANYLVMPVSRAGDRLLIAAADPMNELCLDDVRFMTGMELDVCYAPPEQIQAALDWHYLLTESQVVPEDPLEEPTPLMEDDGGPLTLESAVSEEDGAPIIKLVARILMRAVTQRAGAIHFDPTETDFRVRFRIDGVLHDVARLPLSARASATARLKIVANLDISERRRPQDGSLTLRTKGGDVTFMVVTQPTAHGRAERIVLRRLDASRALDLAEMGHERGIVEAWKLALGQPGLTLLCGPTGSGRTTTYYASLAWLASTGASVVSAEGSVERVVPGVTQIPLNATIGFTMGVALGSMLRSDPDVVALSSVEDSESGMRVVRAALEGRRLLAGFHVPRAHDALGRLSDLGIEAGLVAHSVRAVLAQRLVRTLCPTCREPEPGKSGTYRARGCDQCHGTGFKGRTAVGELLVVDDAIQEAIARGASAREIGALARRRGMRTMREAAMVKVAEGVTSVAEVLAVLGSEEQLP